MRVSTPRGPDWESERKQPTLSTDCTRSTEQTSLCLRSAHSARAVGEEMHGAAACVYVYTIHWRLHHVFLRLISPAVCHRLPGRNQKCKKTLWWKSFNRKSDVNRITETSSSWWYHSSLRSLCFYSTLQLTTTVMYQRPGFVLCMSSVGSWLFNIPIVNFTAILLGCVSSI